MEEGRVIRINKVLRELNISLETAINYLKSKGVLIEASPNSKISNFEFNLLYDKFDLNGKPNNIRILETDLGISLLKLEPNSSIIDENRNCYQIDENNNVNGLKIRNANISKLPSILISFPTLKYLDLANNSLTNISTSINISQLTYLNLSSNKIKDLNFVERLENLEYLGLQNCDLTSLKSLSFSSQSKIRILDLKYNNLKDVSELKRLRHIEKLYLSANNIADFLFISSLEKLKTLDVSYNQLEDIDFLYGLKIEELFLSENDKIKSYDVLCSLECLKVLWLAFNNIKNFTFFDELNQLNSINLSNNNLNDISFLNKQKEVEYLFLNNNDIKDISVLKDFKKLQSLSLINNKIEDIKSFEFIKNLPNLNVLAGENPCFELKNIIIPKNRQNNYQIIVNEIGKLKDSQIKLRLPEKILLLGNHSSGKSSLLHYLQNDNLDFNSDSTHILKIENYPLKYDKLPKAIIYDFGGQDFYHGIYNAFLTVNSTTILLWNNITNSNFSSLDSNGLRNINYDVRYWMGQRLKDEFVGEIILVQTRADDKESRRYNYSNEYVNNGEFFISLKKDKENNYEGRFNLKTLEYLKENINYIIEQKQYNKNKKGEISINSYNLIQFILTSEETHLPVSKKELKKYYDVKDEERFETEIDQLELQGMICIHKENVWLKPVTLAKYFHDRILEKKLIGKGIIDKEAFEKLIDKDVKDFLIDKRVIYLLKNVVKDGLKEEYIIPNYLPLTSDSDADYSLMTFGFNNPLFVIKYKDYIPFGFINQIIIRFGNIFGSKRLWRDQLVFTVSYKELNFKVLIKLDYSELKIKVYAHFDADINLNYKNSIETYLFRKIVKSYNSKNKLPKIDEKGVDIVNNNFDNSVSGNTYLSKDDVNFIFYRDLKDFDVNETKIKTYVVDNKNNFIIDKDKPVSLYQNFTTKKLRTVKKLFVSYSNEDHYYKELLIKNLKSLTQFQLLKPWSCEDMTSGNWHDQIQKELKEADIVVFMMSLNFITSDYILKEEVFKVFEEIKSNPNKKVICVLVKNFSWQYFDKFKKLTGLSDEEYTNLKDANTLTELASKQFIPYYIDKKGTSDEKRYLKPINRWEYEEDAYVEIVRNIIENLE